MKRHPLVSAARFRSIRRRTVTNVPLSAAGFGHGFEGWDPQRTGLNVEAMGRERVARRAEDLVNNQPHAASAVDAMSTSIVGSGLRPMAQVNWKRLGITEDEAAELNEAMEWEWQKFEPEAHCGGRATMGDLEFLGNSSLITHGELVHLPQMVDRPGREFSFCLQDIHSSRLSTPSTRTLDENIIDGVEFDDMGWPEAYWICNPPKNIFYPSGQLPESYYTRIPANIGHRPGLLHKLLYREPEQFRGKSKIGPGMKYFRLMGDSIDYELIGQIIAASFPVAITSQSPAAAAMKAGMFAFGPNGQKLDVASPEGQRSNIRGYSPGQTLYLAQDERAQVLESNRPGNNFDPFAKLILHAMSASLGIPYIVMTKDFSQVNYSSARAAINEAWRVFMVYRTWMRFNYMNPNWRMVQEEAYLRGRLPIPARAPELYDAMPEYMAVNWIGPARGTVDPLKEINAYIKGVESRLYSRQDVCAELNGQDWGQFIGRVGREEAVMNGLGMEEVNV